MHIQQNGGAYTGLCMPRRLIMVPPARLELTAHGLGNRCSIHLSYGG